MGEQVKTPFPSGCQAAVSLTFDDGMRSQLEVAVPLLNADLTKKEREEMQRRVELIHKYWTKDREYLPSPTVGKLVDLDPAQIVKPPKGFEVGYVPIVVRQELAKEKPAKQGR
jgi:hypothetical protein